MRRGLRLYKKPEGGRGEGNRRRKKADILGIFISTQNDSFLILNSFRPFDFFLPRRRPPSSTTHGSRDKRRRATVATLVNGNFCLTFVGSLLPLKIVIGTALEKLVWLSH